MYKSLICCLSLLVVQSALAKTSIAWNQAGCEAAGGVWITSNSPTDTDKGCDADHCNHKNFCAARVAMNWWSSFAWCKSIGRNLAPISSVCPQQALTNNNSCPNFNGISGVFQTATPYGTGSAWTVGGNWMGPWFSSSTYGREASIVNGKDARALCE